MSLRFPQAFLLLLLLLLLLPRCLLLSVRPTFFLSTLSILCLSSFPVVFPQCLLLSVRETFFLSTLSVFCLSLFSVVLPRCLLLGVRPTIFLSTYVLYLSFVYLLSPLSITFVHGTMFSKPALVQLSLFILCTMVQKRKKHRKKPNLIILFPTSYGVSKVSEQMSKRSGARK